MSHEGDTSLAHQMETAATLDWKKRVICLESIPAVGLLTSRAVLEHLVASLPTSERVSFVAAVVDDDGRSIERAYCFSLDRVFNIMSPH